MSQKSKKLFKSIIYVGALLALIFTAWILINIFCKTPIPKPLWTIKDLPTPPPDDQNGWILLKENVKKDSASYSLKSIAGDNAEEIIMMIDFDETMDVGETCVLLSSDNAAAALNLSDSEQYKLFYEAISYPKFLNTNYTLGYPGVIDSKTITMEIYDLFKITLLRAIKLSCDGDYEASLKTLNTLLKATLNFSKTPILLPQMVGVTMTRMALDTSKGLLEYYPKGSGKVTIAPSTFKMFSATVKEARFNALGIENSIEGEYLIQTDAVRYINNLIEGELSEKNLAEAKSRLDQFFPENNLAWIKYPIFFDMGSTLEQINILFEKYHELAQNTSSLEDKGSRSFHYPHYNSFSIFIYNPIGKIILKLFDVDLTKTIIAFDESKEHIRSTASAILKLLNNYQPSSTGTWGAY
ncbi:MAG: hypothetical protein HN337_00935 [Deltaproteobacteria bacterium]|nr:hypothetical protein [Deltaproteobacteria bacterium]